MSQKLHYTKIETDTKIDEVRRDFFAGINGFIQIDTSLEELNLLKDGYYEPATEGIYKNNLEAKEGYFTKFKKEGTTWTKSEVKMPMQDLTPIETKVNDFINFSSPTIDFDLNGFYHLDSGILLNSNGYFATKKYKTYKDLKFINPFKGAGVASQVVFFKENGDFLISYKDQDIITTPIEASFVAFSTNIENSGVEVQSSFWAYQQSKSDNNILENKINIIQNDNSILLNSIDSLNSQIDELSDVNYPYIIDIGNIIQCYGGGGDSFLSATNYHTATKINSTDLQGDFTIVNNKPFSITITDSENKLHIRAVRKIDNNTLRSYTDLPSTVVKFMTTQGDSQHLSRDGWKVLAEKIAEKKTRYNKRKNKTLSALTADCLPYEKDFIKNNETLINITRLPNTATGGWLDQEKGIPYQCEMGGNLSEDTSGVKFKKGYNIHQTTQDKGIEFTLNVGGFSGYLEINLGEKTLNNSAIKIKVEDNKNNVLFNQNVKGVNEYVRVDFTSSVTTLKITISTINNNVSLWSINSVEIFKSYSDDEYIFKNNHTAMFVLDSWGEFPSLISGEDGYINAMGVPMSGLGYLPKHYKEYLETQGFNITSKNYSFGGRTVKWADYWIETFLKNEDSVPDFVFLDFAINDNNSRNYIENTDSAFDFSPTEPFIAKTVSQGGIKGSITIEEHISYYKSLIKKIYKAGSIPVLLINPLLSGLSFGLIEILTAQLNAEFKK